MQHDDALQPDTFPSLDEASFAAIDLARLLAPAISAHPARILLLFGSLRPRGFSRLAAERGRTDSDQAWRGCALFQPLRHAAAR